MSADLRAPDANSYPDVGLAGWPQTSDPTQPLNGLHLQH